MTVIEHRLAGPDDLGFIMDTWLNSHRTSHTAGAIRMDRYYQVYRPEIAALLERPGCQVLVAYKPGEERGSELYGFLCLETGCSLPVRSMRDGQPVERYVDAGPVVHYVYVLEPYRELGVARSLFRAAGIDPDRPFTFTYKTGVASEVLRKRRMPARFNPLIARFPKLSPPTKEAPHEGDVGSVPREARPPR